MEDYPMSVGCLEGAYLTLVQWLSTAQPVLT